MLDKHIEKPARRPHRCAGCHLSGVFLLERTCETGLVRHGKTSIQKKTVFIKLSFSATTGHRGFGFFDQHFWDLVFLHMKPRKGKAWGAKRCLALSAPAAWSSEAKRLE